MGVEIERLGRTCFRTHSKCHEHHLWPGAIVCIDVVPKILGIAWIVKSASGNGGVGQAVGLGEICLRTVGERHERHLWPGAVACVDVVRETLGIAWRVKFAPRNRGRGQAVGLGEICLRTFGERCERHLWLGAVACVWRCLVLWSIYSPSVHKTNVTSGGESASVCF